jgi:hypothetical protein
MSAEGRGLRRPVALAAGLWLVIACLLGIPSLYLFAAATPVALAYAVPAVLVAALGVGLVTRANGVGLLLVSLLLATAMTVIGILYASLDPTSRVPAVVVALYGGAIALSSAFAVRAARVNEPAWREGSGRQVLVALLVGAVAVGGLALAVNFGPLRGCVPIAPRELPSGAAPGQGVEGVSGGAKQVVWGSGGDRVEQIVGLTYWDTFGAEDSPTLVRSTTVRGHPAMLYRMNPQWSDWDLGFSWAEDGCDRTVFLAPGTTPEQAEDFARRY